MTVPELLRYRLINQQIAYTTCHTPQAIVASLVAMQAQEFALAKWAIGLRLPNSTEADIDRAFNTGQILRTHLLRPTWHFVTPADIRWLLRLTAPRVNAANAYWYRKFELDGPLLQRSYTTLIHALQGGNQLTRTALKAALEQEKIVADGMRLAYLLMSAELEGLICSGPRQGNQFTYALLDERVPDQNTLTHEEAVGQLTHRYFRSRGPATLQDFVYWSGLTMKEAKLGASTLPSAFVQEKWAGDDYIFAPVALPEASTFQTTFLLPDYDEYGMSYKNRSVLTNPAVQLATHPPTVPNHWLIVEGMIGGSWQRIAGSKTGEVAYTVFAPLAETKSEQVAQAIERYRAYKGN